jgi:hypothetical protein
VQPWTLEFESVLESAAGGDDSGRWVPRAGRGRRGLCFLSFCLRLEGKMSRDSLGCSGNRVMPCDCNFGVGLVLLCA